MERNPGHEHHSKDNIATTRQASFYDDDDLNDDEGSIDFLPECFHTEVDSEDDDKDDDLDPAFARVDPGMTLRRAKDGQVDGFNNMWGECDLSCFKVRGKNYTKDKV